MTPKQDTPKSPESAAVTRKKTEGFTVEEKAAMKERSRELKAAARLGADREAEERAVVARIAAMSEPDRSMAERLHAIVKASAPTLSAKLWYGMPAYALDGRVVCFFQDGQKFKTRYSTLGFSDKANLDEGGLWPTAYAIKEMNAATEARISALIKKAVG